MSTPDADSLIVLASPDAAVGEFEAPTPPSPRRRDIRNSLGERLGMEADVGASTRGGGGKSGRGKARPKEIQVQFQCVFCGSLLVGRRRGIVADVPQKDELHFHDPEVHMLLAESPLMFLFL